MERGSGTWDVDERVQVGGSAVQVSRFILGGSPIAGLYAPTDEATARETLDAAWRLGVRSIDTAPHYGAGVSEKRIGAFLSEKERASYSISTKVGRLLLADEVNTGSGAVGSSSPAEVFDYSASGVRRSLESSLDRLGLDRVDVALVHDPDDHFEEAMRGAFPTLMALREEGVVGAVGAGMNQAPMLERFVREFDLDCVLIAGRFSLLDQSAGQILLPLCGERNVSVFVGGVFNGGVLADPRPGAFYDYAPAPQALMDRVGRLDAVCRRHGVPLKAAALGFATRHPAITAVVVGASSAEELQEDAQYLEDGIPPAVYADMELDGLVTLGS